jgi:hypothetical protein
MDALPFPIPQEIQEKVEALHPPLQILFAEKLTKSVVWMSYNFGYPDIPELAEAKLNEVLELAA